MHVLFSLRMGGTELGVVESPTDWIDPASRRRFAAASPRTPPGNGSRPTCGIEFDRRDGNDPMFVARLARLLRQARPDILHTHSWGTLCEGLIAARIAGVPHVVHGEHGTMDMRGRNLVVQRWAWGRVDRVLSVSSRLAERMASSVAFPLERIHVVRNGIDTARFNPVRRDAARRKLGLRDMSGGRNRRPSCAGEGSGDASRALARLGPGASFSRVSRGRRPAWRARSRTRRARAGSRIASSFSARAPISRMCSQRYDVFVLSSVSEGIVEHDPRGHVERPAGRSDARRRG